MTITQTTHSIKEENASNAKPANLLDRNIQEHSQAWGQALPRYRSDRWWKEELVLKQTKEKDRKGDRFNGERLLPKNRRTNVALLGRKNKCPAHMKKNTNAAQSMLSQEREVSDKRKIMHQETCSLRTWQCNKLAQEKKNGNFPLCSNFDGQTPVLLSPSQIDYSQILAHRRPQEEVLMNTYFENFVGPDGGKA
jgi:hypothetical protein